MKRSIKRWNLKKIFVIAGVAAMVAGLAGCGGTKKDADKTTEINVGYFNNVTHAQALYMKAQGTLDKAFDGKAKVKWTSFNAGPSEQFRQSVQMLSQKEMSVLYQERLRQEQNW